MDLNAAQLAQKNSLSSNSHAEVSESTPKKNVRQFKNKGRKNFHLDHEPSDEMDLLITTLNDGDFGFKGDMCKLQKHHERYGEGQECDKQEEDQLLQLDSEIEIEAESESELEKSSKVKFGSNNKIFQQALEKAQHFQKKYEHSSQIPDDELPMYYDYRNLSGFNFLNDVRNQGACGSCYTVGFVQSVNARLKLKYGKEVENISPQ